MKDRPKWCPHAECLFIETFQGSICIGKLPEKVEHDGDYNTHRWCLANALPDNEVFDLQINKTDIFWFRLLFDAIKIPEKT